MPEGLIESIPEVYALLKVNWIELLRISFSWLPSFLILLWLLKINLEPEVFVSYLWMWSYRTSLTVWYLSRKFTVYLGKVSLLTIYLVNCHHGHLHYLNSCLCLFENRYLCNMLQSLNVDICLFFLLNTEINFALQLLLHPESDDSAQLSQVLEKIMAS